MEGSWPLFGRATELERVAARLRERSGSLVLAGPAGVGKTRLAEECLAVAAEAGFVPIRVAATQASAGLPFGAFAPLLPEVAPGANRTDLLRQVRHAIAQRGEGRLVALMIDDAHLLDEGSAALTHNVAGSGEHLVLATVRSGEPCSDAIVALWKDGLAERLELGPLARADVVELLTSVLGGPVDGSTLHHFWERTAGNALFLREMVLGAIAADVLANEGGVWRLQGPVPASARLLELIELRLTGLGEAQRDALAVVALGEPLGVDLVAETVTGGDLELLERRALVRIEDDGRRLLVRLAHPLYGDVLRARLSPLRTRAVSRTLADQVERFGARRREDVLRVASWRLTGGGAGEPDLMLSAARQARDRFDYDLAERLARAGIDAGAGFAGDLELAQVHYLQGRYLAVHDGLVIAAPRAAGEADRARSSLLQVDALLWAGQIDQAMALADTIEISLEDPVWLDQLAVKKAFCAFVGGSTAVAVAVLEPLLERLSGDALMEAYFVAAYVLSLSGRASEAIDLSERAMAAYRDGAGTRGSWHESTHLVPLLLALIWSGRLEEADSVASRVYDDAVREGATEPQSWFGVTRAELCRHQGLGNEASRLAFEAVRLARPLERYVYLRTMLGILAGALALAGRTADAQGVIEELETFPAPTVGWWESDIVRTRAWLAVAAGDSSEARRLLDDAAAMAAAVGDFVFESAALHDLARLGEARRVVERLRTLVGVVEGPLAATRLAHTEALCTRDAPGLEAASAAFEDLGARLLAAEAAADAAVAWRRSGDGRKATAAERRAHALAARCQAARTPALTAVEARTTLSDRELEIARLAAAGVSNKDIAARLFLSVRTVENKLHAAYEKLGVSGRAELADALGTS